MRAATVPPDPERFASEAVSAGPFRDIAVVVVPGGSLWQRAERARVAFVRSLEAAEADREGWHGVAHDMAEAASNGVRRSRSR